MTNRLPNRSERQTAIYVNGFEGKRSKIPVDAAKLEQKAIIQMSKKATYIAGGAGLQSSVTNNRTSFEKYNIVPRMLRNISIRDTSIELFGKKFS